MATLSWAAVAAEMHRIADALATLDLNMPDPPPEPHVSITLSNSGSVQVGIDDEIRMASVDAIALAVLGRPAEMGQTFADGKRRYGPHREPHSPIHVSIFDTVADPAQVSEMERLRAEVAELRRLAGQP